MTTTLSQYTGRNNGWGTMQSFCSICGEIVAEYECDEDGRPIRCLFNNIERHVCDDTGCDEDDEEED